MSDRRGAVIAFGHVRIFGDPSRGIRASPSGGGRSGGVGGGVGGGRGGGRGGGQGKGGGQGLGKGAAAGAVASVAALDVVPALAVVAAGSSGNSSGGVVNPPGFLVGYDAITASVNITATTEGTAQTVITCAAHTFDGSAVWCEYFGLLIAPNLAGKGIHIGVFESGSLVMQLAYIQSGSQQSGATIVGKAKFTPTAGSHSYIVAGWVDDTTGVPKVVAGAGGPGNTPPSYVAFVKS